MATKKKASKKAAKKKTTKKGAKGGPCVSLKINSDGTTTPEKIRVFDGGCVTFSTPDGFDVDITLKITLIPGGGGPVIIHS